MIRRVLTAIRARRARLDSDRRALASYRANVPYLRRWLAEMPDICVVLEQVSANAGDSHADYEDMPELRDKVRDMRRAAQHAAMEKEHRQALAHLRLLVRDIDGVGESWADERRRCTLSGGVVTLGEMRAAKAFITRIDSERIKRHEKSGAHAESA